jgi:tetratricopeptide (TPR) repeat protein
LHSLTEPDRARELLEVASEAVPALEAVHDDRALGRAWLSIGHVRGGFYCEYGAWEEAAARAAEHYRRAGWSPSTSLGELASALYLGPRDVTSAIARCRDLLLEHKGDRASEANLLVWLGGLVGMRGHFSDARELIAQAAQRYEQLGLSVEPHLRVRGSVEMLAGAPDVAEEALTEACAALLKHGQNAVLATRAAELADSICEQGRHEEAETWIRRARELAGSDDLDAAFAWRYVHAKILARRGAVEEAHTFAREALDLVAPTDALNRHGDALLVLAEIARLRGRENHVRQHVRDALRLYEQKGNVVATERANAMLASPE